MIFLCSLLLSNLNLMTDMPKEYIYEPWTAPISVQRKAKCIIGLDYPKPGQLFSLLAVKFSNNCFLQSSSLSGTRACHALCPLYLYVTCMHMLFPMVPPFFFLFFFQKHAF